MTTFLYYLLEVFICSGLLYFFYLVALRNAVFHRWNRFYLLSAVILSVALPLIRFSVSPENENMSQAWEILSAMRSAQQSVQGLTTVESGTNLLHWSISIFYSIGSVIFLCLCLLSVRKIMLLSKTKDVQWIGHIKMIQTEAPGTPFSFLHYIFWNPKISLQSTTGQQILQHELVHVYEKHTWDKLFLQVVQAIFWYNPFFGLIKKELHCIHEFIADQKSVGEGGTTAFAAMILQAAYPQQYNTLVNPFFQTQIKRRIEMLTKKQNPVVNYFSRLLVLPLVALTVMAFTVQVEKDKAAQQSPTTSATVIGQRLNTDTIPTNVEDIERVDVDKEKKTVKITYKNGTVQELTEKELKEKNLIEKKGGQRVVVRDLKSSTTNPLYIIDGEEYKGILEDIDPNTIESVNVLKGESALKQYGEKGRNGVIEIKRKKGSKKAGKEI